MCFCFNQLLAIYIRERNFYPIDTKFGKQVGIVNSKVQFEDGLCGPYATLGGITKKLHLNNFSTTNPIFDLKVSFDMKTYDFVFGDNPQGVTLGTLESIFNGTKYFLTHFIEYQYLTLRGNLWR